MLYLITCKVRSENGYGFLRPGLKTGVGNGFFGLKLGMDLEMRAAHPHQKFQGVPPGGDAMSWRFAIETKRYFSIALTQLTSSRARTVQLAKLKQQLVF